MKLPTRIAGEEILFVNHEDLAAQLEQKVLDLDKRLAELDKLRKKRWLFAQALKQIRGELPGTTPPLATGQDGKKSGPSGGI